MKYLFWQGYQRAIRDCHSGSASFGRIHQGQISKTAPLVQYLFYLSSLFSQLYPDSAGIDDKGVVRLIINSKDITPLFYLKFLHEGDEFHALYFVQFVE